MNYKILIIEDELELLDNITTLLQSYNYTVITAYDGEEGIKLIKEHSPDLIICDIMMPKMDGYEVIKKLNADCKMALIPFIFLTAKAEHNDLRKGMELGADDYISKPFTSEELLTSIQTRLKKFETIKATLSNEHFSEKPNKLKSGDSILLQINYAPFFIKLEKIKCILADRQYSNLILKEGKRVVVRKSLNEWEEILPEDIFIRIHRHTIININFINRIDRAKTNYYKIVLNDTLQEFEISRRYHKKLRDQFALHKSADRNIN